MLTFILTIAIFADTVTPPSHNTHGLASNSGVSSGAIGGAIANYVGGSAMTAISDPGSVASSPYFVFVTGVASVLGLLASLYQTQVRYLPESLYRSRTWIRNILISVGAGCVLVSVINFYRIPDINSSFIFGAYSDLRDFCMAHPSLLPDTTPEMSEETRSSVNSSNAFKLVAFALFFGIKNLSLSHLTLILGLLLLRKGSKMDPLNEVSTRFEENVKTLLELHVELLARINVTGENKSEVAAPLRSTLEEVLNDVFRHMQTGYVDMLLGRSLTRLKKADIE